MSVTGNNEYWFRRSGRIRGCFVYMLFCGEGDGASYVKVGMTEKPEQRLDALRTAVPMKTEMFATVELPGRRVARIVERELHQALAQWGSRGEWFKVTKDDRLAFQQAWKRVFVRHERPNWPLRWSSVDMPAYERWQAQRRQAFQRQYKRRGRAYRDFLQSSRGSDTQRH